MRELRSVRQVGVGMVELRYDIVRPDTTKSGDPATS